MQNIEKISILVSRNANQNLAALPWAVSFGDGERMYADTHYGAETLADEGLVKRGFEPDRLYDLYQDLESKPAHIWQERWDLVGQQLKQDEDENAIWESVKWIVPELAEDQDGGEELRVAAIMAEAVEINEDMALQEIDTILSRYGWTRDGLTPIRPQQIAA